MPPVPPVRYLGFPSGRIYLPTDLVRRSESTYPPTRPRNRACQASIARRIVSKMNR